jgi:hypothetical protein
VVFIETSIFTRRVLALLDDDQYRELQNHLAAHPESGKIIPGSGGLRKVRWAARGRGKRGGLRVIYFWWVSRDRISMLFIYAKNEQDDLTPAQLKLLKQALEL